MEPVPSLLGDGESVLKWTGRSHDVMSVTSYVTPPSYKNHLNPTHDFTRET